MRKISLTEAVLEFGTDAQKKCIEEGRKWRKESNDSLIKTLKQHYQVVIEEGRGKKKFFILDKPYDDIQSRQDKRKNNGANQLPYEYELNSLVLDYVLNNCKNNFVSMSLTQWLMRMGLIDPRIVAASNNEDAIYQHLDMLKEKYEDKFANRDIVMLKHFVETEVNRLRRNLASVFEKLAKHKIIIHTKEMYGAPLNGEEHRALTKLELKCIGEMKRELCKKYDVSLNDFRKMIRAEKSPFRSEYEENLRAMGFDYIYESHGCVVQVSDKIIEQYFDDLNKKNELVFSYGLNQDNILMMMSDFKGYYASHSLNLAEKRQANPGVKEHKHIRQLKAFGEYLPMWELLLIFYDLTNYIEPRIKVESVYDDDLGVFH